MSNKRTKSKIESTSKVDSKKQNEFDTELLTSQIKSVQKNETF